MSSLCTLPLRTLNAWPLTCILCLVVAAGRQATQQTQGLTTQCRWGGQLVVLVLCFLLLFLCLPLACLPFPPVVCCLLLSWQIVTL